MSLAVRVAQALSLCPFLLVLPVHAADHPASATPVVVPVPTPSLVPAPEAIPFREHHTDIATQQNPTEVSLIPEADAAGLTLDKSGGIILTLEQSVNLAIRSATSVLKAQNDVVFNGAQLLQAYGQFLPNLTGSGNYQYDTGKTYYTTGAPTYIVGSNNNAAFTLQSDLNIFNGLSDYSNLKSSLLKKDSADLTFYRAKQQISLDISQNFLQVVLDKQLVNIARKNLQESQERERLLDEQTKVGARNLSDLFRQQAQTSQDESALIASQNRTRTDQITFLRKLRADVSKNYHFVEPEIPEGHMLETFQSEDVLISKALSRRADLKASDEVADASNWDVHSAWGNYLPKLDLIGAMNSGAHYLDNQTVNGANVVPPLQNGLTYQLGNQIEYSVGLTLTWTLFDRFITRQNVSRARVTADNSQIDAQDRRNQVEGDVRQSYGDYITALQQLRTSKKGLEAARKAYEVMEGRYEVGGASFLDLITAQDVLVQAESARAQALIGYQLQVKSLDFAMGDTPVD
jgi:outer membrane protein